MTYFNNAATSFPKPREVHQAVASVMEAVPYHAERVGWEKQHENPFTACREKLVRLFHADSPCNIVFTSGATESLNLALRGLDLQGGHVITTATEHNSVLRPLHTMMDEGMIELSIVPCDACGFVDPQDVAAAIRPDSRAVVVNHASNVTGAVQNLKAISAIAHASNCIFVVDASQSTGTVDIDVLADDIDLLAFTGHKSLFGLPGTGGLYIRESIDLKPLKVGGTGVRSDLLRQPQQRPMLYEAGTPNLPGIVALNAGIDYVLKIGVDRIHDKKHGDIATLAEQLQDTPGIVIYGDPHADQNAGVLSFNIDGMSPADIGYMLDESFGIVVRTGLHCAPLIHKAVGSYPDGSLRISPSYFTTEEDIERLVQAVQQISSVGCPA